MKEVLFKEVAHYYIGTGLKIEFDNYKLRSTDELTYESLSLVYFDYNTKPLLRSMSNLHRDKETCRLFTDFSEKEWRDHKSRHAVMKYHCERIMVQIEEDELRANDRDILCKSHYNVFGVTDFIEKGEGNESSK